MGVWGEEREQMKEGEVKESVDEVKERKCERKYGVGEGRGQE